MEFGIAKEESFLENGVPALENVQCHIVNKQSEDKIWTMTTPTAPSQGREEEEHRGVIEGNFI